GTLLPFFTSHCEDGVKSELGPTDIIESFFGQYEQYVHAADRFDLLFRFIQYIERQVVLFDAVEDASFNKTGRFEDTGSLNSLFQQAASSPAIDKKIKDKLKDFSLRLVLTAHPTQFYPGPVLAIITDLIEALKQNDINSINLLLKQLGKTPFFNKNKPSPVDEAASLAWFLENVFYQTTSSIQSQIDKEFDLSDSAQFIELGFWPGGDRDGNPNVTTESTKTVSALLRTILFRCYYRDFRNLKRRVTFRGVEGYISTLQDLFYENSFNVAENPENQQAEILANLEAIKKVLVEVHDGLFLDKVEDLINKVKLFGCYFASLDIRQDSRILRNVHQYALKQNGIERGTEQFTEEERIVQLAFKELDFHCPDQPDPLIKDTLDTIRLVKKLQFAGGEKACHRFIISNCQQASDILQLMELFLMSGWKKESLNIDFVPLFETIDDLSKASQIMEVLYTHPFYCEHLKRRNNKQTIMLGFSDSTKDGGYLMANWSILKAKVALTTTARTNGVKLVFFDGRGGPPARGGGKTHLFYASMGKDMANDHIQLTIQGQTISSQYGSFDSAHYNMEQLINAGIVSSLASNNEQTLNAAQTDLIASLANDSYEVFAALTKHPLFLKYLEKYSPLKLLSQINISSRPVKRNVDSELRLEDLRAISFVTAWSQLKQNIPGYYGVGTALKKAKDNGSFNDIKTLYNESGQFKTMIDNCMMSMSKSDFRLTAHLENDGTFGPFWKMIRDEFELTRNLLLEVSDTHSLMEQYPVERKSIALREKIVLPLVIIQHYALQQLNKSKASNLDDSHNEIYDKLIIRTVYGIVNAGRNLV
uniref:phosphoenolpyruvate carboxylase n=1 Tax=Daejeonella sp. TaxID=2805397 RepID=UPI0037C168A4